MMNKIKIDNSIGNSSLKTRVPIMLVLWLFITVILFLFLLINEMVLWGVCFYVGIISGLYYFIFCRYSCTIKVIEKKLQINYLVFWLKNKDINLTEVINYNYRKGFYDFFSEKPQSEYYNIICYDSLIINLINGKKIEINLNTRIGDFGKIRNILNKTIKENYLRNKKKFKH